MPIIKGHLLLLLILVATDAQSAGSCFHLEGVAKSNCQGQEYAKSLQARTANAATAAPTNVPHFQGTEVPEVALYGQGGNLKDLAKEKSVGNLAVEVILQQEQRRLEVEEDAKKTSQQINPYSDEEQTAGMICADGSCARNLHHPDLSGADFTKTIAHAHGAFALATEVKQNNPLVFGGKMHKCKVNRLPHFRNCCEGGEGWGVDLGISKCSGDEKELALHKQEQKVIYLGNYRAGNWVDRRVYHSFCSYPTKLARIIVYQAKAQLKKSFGSSKHPDCSGISLANLEQLDFAQIDLSEIYQDYPPDWKNLPGLDQMILRFKDRLNRPVRQ